MITTDTAPEPYVGLRPYGADDAGRFHGRAREVWDVTSLALSTRLVVVYGSAGVGKTSLLQAGVLPGLRHEQAQWLPLGSVPRASALHPLPARGQNRFTSALLASWAPGTAERRLRGMTLLELFRTIPKARHPSDPRDEAPLPLVAMIDQFEEVFAHAPDVAPDREDFLAQLSDAMRQLGHLHLVLCIRQDAMGELLPYESRLYAGNRRRYQLEPLDREAAIEAVTGPLAASPRTFAPGVAQDLVERLMTTTVTDDGGTRRTVTTRTVEPISLQVTCLALWRTLADEVTTITGDLVTQHLHQPGDVETTLTSALVRAVMDVAAQEEVPEPEVWAWLEDTFVTDRGTRSATYEGLTHTGGMPNAVARAFEGHGILRSETRLRSVWFELVHDVLIDPIRHGRRLSAGLAAGAEVIGVGADAYLGMAKAALREGSIPLAAEYAWGAVRASQLDPRRLAESRAFLGELVLGQGRAASGHRADELYEEAELSFRYAAQLFDTERDFRAVGRQQAALGRLLMERGRFAAAAAELRSALDRLPGDVEIRLDFARALGHSGQVRAALGEYTAALVSMPEDATQARAEALAGRAVLNAEHGDPLAALHDLDDAIRLQPHLAHRPDIRQARHHAESRAPTTAAV